MITLKITDGRCSTYPYRRKLAEMGFRFYHGAHPGGYWQKDCEDDCLKGTEKFCRRYGLTLSVYQGNYRRSNDCRAKYFAVHKGLLKKGRYYQCAYCGKIVSRQNITIDHLVPVDKVVKSRTRQRYIKLLSLCGITDINDLKNLVAACRQCNMKKGTKTGLWVVRGSVGKSPVFWFIFCPLLLFGLPAALISLSSAL